MLIVLSAALGVLVAVGACLPDLVPIADDATMGPTGCGDRVIATLADGGDSGESCDPGPDAAGVFGCKNCQIICESEGGLDPSTGHCYFKLDPESEYSTARLRCSLRGAHVVTFSSDAEVKLVNKLAPGGYWVGLAHGLFGAYVSDQPEEPGFPIAPIRGPCEGCYGVGALDSGDFASSDAAPPDQLLCVASTGEAWISVPCFKSESRTTVCEREPQGMRSQEDCPISGICFTVAKTAAEKRYVVFVSESDPTSASQSCAAIDGGSLAVFATREEREELAHEIIPRFPPEAELWIGLSANDAGVWIWDDGVAADDPNRAPPWGDQQPDGGAGVRAYMRIASTDYDTQLAHADNSNTMHSFICQRPAH